MPPAANLPLCFRGYPLTTAQNLTVRLSAIRQRLNELSSLDDLIDEQRSEMTKLTAEYPTVEERHQAAIVAESEQSEQRQAGDVDGGEGAELRKLQGRARLSN